MDLGQKLYEYRKEKGLSQEEVAEKINVTRQSVSKWETNQSTPDFDKIIPICELYGITPDELISGVKKEDIVDNITKENEDKKKKKAFGIGLGVLIYFIAIAWIMITIPVLEMNPIVSSALFLVIIGLGTFSIIYSCLIYKTEKPKEELTKEQIMMNKIDDVLAILFTIIYFTVSFLTMAWHITWIIWIVYGLVKEIVKLLFMLKGDKDEK